MKSSIGTIALLATLMIGTLLYADKGRGRSGKERGGVKPEAVEVATEAEPEDEDDDIDSVVIVEGDKPFEVTQDEVVRLIGKGIAGSKATATVKGPAKIDQQATIRRIVNGKPLIGAGDTEFDIEPTGKGEVTVTISVKLPNSDKPEVKTYSFTVK